MEQLDLFKDLELTTDEQEAWADLMNDREAKWEDPPHSCIEHPDPIRTSEKGFKPWWYCKVCGKLMREFNPMRAKVEIKDLTWDL